MGPSVKVGVGCGVWIPLLQAVRLTRPYRQRDLIAKSFINISTPDHLNLFKTAIDVSTEKFLRIWKTGRGGTQWLAWDQL